MNAHSRNDAPHGARHATHWLARKRTLAATAALALLVGWGLTGEWLRDSEMQKEIDRLQVRATDMEDKNKQLALEGQTVSSDAMLEREARLKMNLQKPGEQVVVVDGPAEGVTVTDGGSADAGQAQTSNAGRWWRYFFR